MGRGLMGLRVVVLEVSSFRGVPSCMGSLPKPQGEPNPCPSSTSEGSTLSSHSVRKYPSSSTRGSLGRCRGRRGPRGAEGGPWERGGVRSGTSNLFVGPRTLVSPQFRSGGLWGKRKVNSSLGLGESVGGGHTRLL